MPLVCKVCCDSLAHIRNEARLRGIRKGMVNVDNYADVQHLFVLLPMSKYIKTGSLLDCTAASAGKDPFCQQNITQNRKLFITQSKHIIF